MVDKLKKKYAIRILSRVLRKGGSLVSKKISIERKNKCEDCVHFGKVFLPLVNLEFDGCTLCKCPIKTKTEFDILMRDPENYGKSITPGELVKSFVLQKDYIPEKNKCSNTNLEYKGATGEDYWN